MKFTVLGFSQKRAVELGLSIDELLVLRWFVDFYGSKSMVKLSTDEGVYAWVNYKSLLDDMPIITCNKRHLAERFKKLSDVGALKHKTIRQGGIFSAFAFGPEYQSLVADTKLQDLGGDSPKTDVPTSENGHTLRPKTDEQNINLQEDPSTKDQEKENREKAPAAQPARKFIPPTMEEVRNYCRERNKGVDPEKWYDHYLSNGWMVGKTKMKDWKAAVRTWEKNGYNSRPPEDDRPPANPWEGMPKL